MARQKMKKKWHVVKSPSHTLWQLAKYKNPRININCKCFPNDMCMLCVAIRLKVNQHRCRKQKYIYLDRTVSFAACSQPLLISTKDKD